jgi:hypothetical protein
VDLSQSRDVIDSHRGGRVCSLVPARVVVRPGVLQTGTFRQRIAIFSSLGSAPQWMIAILRRKALKTDGICLGKAIFASWWPPRAIAAMITEAMDG